MTQTPVAFAGQVALCNYLRLLSRDTEGDIRAVQYAFQNFYFGETVVENSQPYLFVPFGFSGIGTSKTGDIEPASLVFPNNDIARAIISESLRGEDIDDQEPERILLPYIAKVDVCLINVETDQKTNLYTYTGICNSANWSDTEAVLELGGVLDAVSGEIPTRTLRRDLVGNLPTSPSVRIR